jgi:hypothetical protein
MFQSAQRAMRSDGMGLVSALCFKAFLFLFLCILFLRPLYAALDLSVITESGLLKLSQQRDVGMLVSSMGGV